MPVNSNNQLKCKEGSTTEPLTIKQAGMETLNFGDKYVVYIKETIEGYDHFLPSDGLVNKMKEENVDIGDVIKITKAEKSEKYPFGYFSVEIVDKAKQEDSGPVIDKGISNFEKQFKEPENNLSIHEFSLRLETVEKKVDMLLGDAGHKPGDESIPL